MLPIKHGCGFGFGCGCRCGCKTWQFFKKQGAAVKKLLNFYLFIFLHIAKHIYIYIYIMVNIYQFKSNGKHILINLKAYLYIYGELKIEPTPIRP